MNFNNFDCIFSHETEANATLKDLEAKTKLLDEYEDKYNKMFEEIDEKQRVEILQARSQWEREKKEEFSVIVRYLTLQRILILVSLIYLFIFMKHKEISGFSVSD